MESIDNEDMKVREFCANGSCIKTAEVEAMLDEGNIQEAESALREGLSLNSEVSLFVHTLSICYQQSSFFKFLFSSLLVAI